MKRNGIKIPVFLLAIAVFVLAISPSAFANDGIKKAGKKLTAEYTVSATESVNWDVDIKNPKLVKKISYKSINNGKTAKFVFKGLAAGKCNIILTCTGKSGEKYDSVTIKVKVDKNGKIKSAKAKRIKISAKDDNKDNDTDDRITIDNDLYKKPVSTNAERIVAVYEAEKSTCKGSDVTVEKNLTGYSGSGYMRFACSDFECVFDIEITKDGNYILDFVSAGIGGEKRNNVTVDQKFVGEIVTENADKWNSCDIAGVYLTKGKHTVTVTPSWGWFYMDKMTIKADKGIDVAVYNVNPNTVNPNATKEAKAIKKYLAENYGKKVISGQVCDDGINGAEYKYVKDVTGKYPAILGLDFMNYSGYAVDNGTKPNSTDVAIEYWNKYGGISTFCWHWFAPKKFHKQGYWYKTFESGNVEMNLGDIMDGKDPEGYKLLMEDVDRIAYQIERLQKAGAPIMFRPLHEASGGWFWWGNYGSDAYKKLYIAIYDRLTNKHGLNNIIWIWNGQDSEWYPGDKYVDIIGTDIYGPKADYSSRVNYFNDCLTASDKENKIICQSECGTLSDVEEMFRDGCIWSYWCTWCGEHCLDESNTSKEQLKKIYSDNRVITLSDLPDFKK